MSANLWDASAATMKPDADGVYLSGKAGELHCAIAGTSALAENQTIHMGASLRGADAGYIAPYVGYMDAAGNKNWVGFPHWTPTDQWQRFDGSCIVPSGMTITNIGLNTAGATGNMEVINPVFSYGSSIVLAIASSTIAWSAGILTTVRYYQLAAPTAATPTVPTTSDDLGSWTETEPAADVTKVLWTCERTVYADGTESWSKASKSTSYEAAKDAKGTANAAKDAADGAQQAASAAQNTADSASSTAGAAKSTADSLATLIREDSTGITVGKSADGKTYSTGRTHMDEDSYDILDKAGNVVATFSGAAISMLMGLLTITAGHNGGGEIYPADGKDLLLKSGKDAEVSGNRGSYIEVNDEYVSLNSAPAGGAINSLFVYSNGIFAQTQGAGGLMLCPVHSMYNKNNGVHVYTGKASEISDLTSNGWTDEGVKLYAFLDPGNR